MSTNEIIFCRVVSNVHSRYTNNIVTVAVENIMMNQLEGEIQIPDKLDFECSDRSLLMDQLKILQMVLRRQKNNSAGCLANKAHGSQLRSVGSPTKNESATAGRTLKDKVETHKEAMSQKRENKLKEMDEQAEALFKSSNEKTKIDKSNVNEMKEELNNLKIIEESIERSCSSQEKKRNHSDFDDCCREFKKSRSSYGKSEEGVQECTQSTNKSVENNQGPSSLKGASIIEVFEASNSSKSRSAVREKAIKMLRQQGFDVSVVEPGNFAMKYALSAPYHVFFSRVEKSKATYEQERSITLPEILDTSLGEIVCSLQINFMVDVGWLCLQYLLAGQRTDMTILFGERVDEEKLGIHITMVPVQMPTKFGCHHTKVMILKYKDDGIRVVVSTANLYSDDWENRTQGSVT